MRSLHLVLTADCNLRCRYCYENRKTRACIDRRTIAAAIDALRRSPHQQVEITLTGGEPLLAFDLFRDAVRRAGTLRHAGKTVRLRTVTNGTLLDPERAAFLAAHRIDTALSFDGVRAVQDLRAPGTFVRLDRLLARLEADQPDFYRERLTVGITLTGANLPWLADSVRYFLGRRLRRIAIDPLMTDDGGFRPDDIRVLEDQFERVLRLCVEHCERTGDEPFIPLRPTRRVPWRHGHRIDMCEIGDGESLAVDVDGQVYGCVSFATSYQALPPGLLREELGALRLGHIRDPDLPESVRRYRRAFGEAGIFADKQDKHSSYGRCRECAFLRECMVCPLSIGHLPGNRDPRRVPDLPCAVNRVAGRYRARFPRRKEPINWIPGRKPLPPAARTVVARLLHRAH